MTCGFNFIWSLEVCFTLFVLVSVDVSGQRLFSKNWFHLPFTLFSLTLFSSLPFFLWLLSHLKEHNQIITQNNQNFSVFVGFSLQPLFDMQVPFNIVPLEFLPYESINFTYLLVLAGPVCIMSLLLLFHRLLTDLWMDIWLILTKYVQLFYQNTACPRNVLRFLKTTKWNLSWKCTKSQEKAKRPENNYCLILSPTWLHYWEVCSWFREL